MPVKSEGVGIGTSSAGANVLWSRSSGPWQRSRKSAASSMVRDSGPWQNMVSHWVGSHSKGIRPEWGFKPTQPECDAGMRTEPPASEPSASGTQPLATAAAEPPDEPPGVRSGFHGLRVIPHSALKVLLEKANSGVVVLPTMMAPAVSRFSTTRASKSGTQFS